MAGVKGKSGRKCKSQNRNNTEKTLAETSPAAAAYLREVVTGKVLKPNPIRVDTCKYVINQDIGAPTQRAEIKTSGGIELWVRYDGNRNETGDSTPEAPAS